jgi:amidase
MPLAPSLDTVGWFTRDIALFDRVGAVMLGEDQEGPALSRVITAEDGFAALVSSGEAEALAPAAGRARDAAGVTSAVTVAPEGLDTWVPVFRTIQGYEAWQAHGAWVTARRPDLMPTVRERFLAASRVTETDYRDAVEKRARIRAHVTALLGDDGMLLLPTLPTIAPRLDDAEEAFEAFRARALSILCIAGLAGLPQISLPLATFEGCPLGLSLIAPAGRDRALISFAARLLAG